MFRKFQISNRLPKGYFPKIVVGCPCFLPRPNFLDELARKRLLLCRLLPSFLWGLLTNYISPSASTCRSPRVFYCFNVHLLVAVIRYSAKIFEQFSKVIHVLLKRLFYSVVNSNYSYSEYMKLAFFLCIFLTVYASKTFQLLSNHKVT